MFEHVMRRMVIVAASIVGPFASQLSAQSNYNWKSVKVAAGGYVPGIIFSPVQQGLAYCRTDIGGFYKWDNSTKQWMPLGDWSGASNLMGGESIAADPKDAKVVYMAAGMYGNEKAAMMRSRDQGKTFET